MSEPSPCLVMDGVSKSYRRPAETVTALHDVTLSAGFGELICIQGPSGSGKSTLLKAVAALVPIDAGTIRIGHHELTQCSESEKLSLRQESVGVIFQKDVMIDDFTASENVALPLEATGMEPDSARGRALEAMDLVGISPLADRLPGDMSGGQLQRVGVARALAGGQRILLADEPTASLDSEATLSMYRLFRSLADDRYLVLLATHDDRARGYSTDTVVIRDGILTRPGLHG